MQLPTLNKERRIRLGDRVTLIKLKKPSYGLINKFLGKRGTVRKVKTVGETKYYVVNFEPIEFLDFLLSRDEIRKVNQRPTRAT